MRSLPQGRHCPEPVLYLVEKFEEAGISLSTAHVDEENRAFAGRARRDRDRDRVTMRTIADIGSATLKRADGINPLGGSVSGRHYSAFPRQTWQRPRLCCVFSPRSEREMLAGTPYDRPAAVFPGGIQPAARSNGLQALAWNAPQPMRVLNMVGV